MVVMVVGFTTTFATVPTNTNVVSSNPTQPQHYVIKLVSELWHVGGFLRVLRFPLPTSKTDLHDMTEILLTVA